MIELNKVHLMSNIDGMKEMDAQSVDLIVTSPPYDNLREYNGSSSWNFDVFKEVAEGIVRVLKPGGVVAWNVGDAVIQNMHGKKSGPSLSGTSFKQCVHFMELGLNFHDNLIYEKHAARFASGVNSLRYTGIYEYVFVLSKGRPNTIHLIADRPNKGAGKVFKRDGGRGTDGERIKGDGRTGVIHDFGVRHNIWRYVTSFGSGQTNKKAYKHPAIMPSPLVSDLIKSYSNEGDLVLDPFMGSGTTAREAHALGRQHIGFEIDPTYHALCEEINAEEMGEVDETNARGSVFDDLMG
jgi:DNA modification methylase